MKLFEISSIPNYVQIHTDSVIPPSIKRYDGVHTAPVSLATDIRLEGEGREQHSCRKLVSHKGYSYTILQACGNIRSSVVYTSFFAFGSG